MTGKTETATLAAGCFWCVETVFSRLKGVDKVVSGYTGGAAPNPSYHEVCSGTTGHAEAVRVEFDPDEISFEALLEVFWRTHDPTTLNRQGADVGTQYRSAIFYHDKQQRRIAESSKRAAEEAKLWPAPFVTEIVPAGPFFEAEPYHQNYYEMNPHQTYCRLVIEPKIRKLHKDFAGKLKS